MILARLCLLPPLEGFRRVLGPKLRRLVQCVESSGEREILFRSPQSDAQQAGLADLGISLITGLLTEGWLNDMPVEEVKGGLVKY